MINREHRCAKSIGLTVATPVPSKDRGGYRTLQKSFPATIYSVESFHFVNT